MQGLMEQEACRTLVAKAQRGDQSAFGELAAKYASRLRALIESRLGPQLRSQIQPDDVAQEVLVWAFRSIKNLHWQGDDSFFRWLGGITENVLRKEAQRHRGKLALPLIVDVEASEASPSQSMRRAERFEHLQGCLDDLSPDHRQVIILARIDRLSFKEIAHRMNRSEVASRQLLRRALKELKAGFGDTESLHLPDRRLEPNGDTHGD